MLIHPEHPDHHLFDMADLECDPLPEPLRDCAEQVRTVRDWARDYLCSPHPQLGRRGDVCPFTETAMRRSTFWVTVLAGHPTRGELERMLVTHRDWFRDLSPQEGPGAQFKTILIVLPDLDPTEVSEVVDGTQRLLKTEYTAHGLMLGEFHDGPPQVPGLWNPDFRPLRAPLPMLVIRHMVPTDLPFLVSDPEQLAAYLARFGDRLPAAQRELASAAATRFGMPVPERAVRLRAKRTDNPVAPTLPTPAAPLADVPLVDDAGLVDAPALETVLDGVGA